MIPPAAGARKRKTSTSSSNSSLARVEAPPDAYQASASPRRYARVHGESLAKSWRVASRNSPLQRRSTKSDGGVQTGPASVSQAVGIACGGSGGGAGSAATASEAVVAAVVSEDGTSGLVRVAPHER